jgi:catechol 2,3-dioxygenase-like lactoylglutathione lyase family enzyme
MPEKQFWNPMVPELLVSDFARSFYFYTEILGFKALYRRGAPNFAYLDQEGVQLMLDQITDDNWITAELQAPLGRGINFQMELGNIDPVHERLLKIGYPFYREIQDIWYNTGTVMSGQREFLIQDPDGYLLRFAQFLGDEAL